MYFDMKSYLKSTRNHTAKHALNMVCVLYKTIEYITKTSWKLLFT